MSIIPERGDVSQPENYIPPEVLPDYDSFVTQDDKPVDSWYCERQLRLLTDALYASWKGPREGQPRCVASDVGLFYSITEPAIVPDVMISLDVSLPKELFLKKNRSYFSWEFGKFPEMTVEVVSNNEGGELSSKLDTYARIRIPYYVVWDPYRYLSEQTLHCFVLNGSKYVPCEPWFPDLQLGVTVWEGVYDDIQAPYLRWCDRQGNVLLTGIERAAKLADKLRELGVDPNQV